MKKANAFAANLPPFVLVTMVAMFPLGCGDSSSSSPAEVRSSSGDTETGEPTFPSNPTGTEAPPHPTETPPPSPAMAEPSPTCSTEADATRTPPVPATATPDVCSRRCPDYCIQVYEPVCGTDGCTYGNSCEAHCVGVSVARAGRCDEEPATATPLRTPEPSPEPLAFPGCEDVTAESHYCVTLSGGAVTLLGLDTGDACTVVATEAPIGTFLVSGSIAWQDDSLYVCGQDGLIRISLRDGSWEVGGTPCAGVASYDGGLLVNRWLVVLLDPSQVSPWSQSPLSWYPDYESVRNDEPERTFGFGSFSATMAVQGDLLYTAWHAGISIDVADLAEDSTLGVLSLEDYDGWMLGMSVTEDGYLILSGDPWGRAVYVFDVYDGHQISRHDLSTIPSGLACVANEAVMPRDTPTVTPTPTLNTEQEATATPCLDWFNCHDACSTLQSEPSPFRLYELPPSIPIEENCLGGGYGSSNYAAPEEVLVPDATEELHVIGIYTGRGNPGFRPSAQGIVEVTVHARPKPVVLALSSYEGMLWRITLDPGARLSRVILNGYYKQEVEGVPPGVPILERDPSQACGYAYGWEVEHNTGGGSYNAMIASLRQLTGLVETSFQGCYAGNRFEVPYWSGDPPTGAPTPVPGDEDVPRSDVVFPGCGAVTAEAGYCLTTTPGSVSVVGLESGNVCRVADSTVEYLGHDVSSLSWRGEILYVCPHAQGLVRISLRDGSWQSMQAECESVADYDGGLLVGEDYFRTLSLYPSLADVLTGTPAATYSFGGGYSRIATSGDTFYGAWHSTDELVVGDLDSGQTLPPLHLEGFDGWVHGIAKTNAGELVVIGDYAAPFRKALFFFDAMSGAQLRTVPVSDWIGGLACVSPGSGG